MDVCMAGGMFGGGMHAGVYILVDLSFGVRS